MLHDYWMNRPDDQFVAQYMRGVGDVIDWFEKHLTANDPAGESALVEFCRLGTGVR